MSLFLSKFQTLHKKDSNGGGDDVDGDGDSYSDCDNVTMVMTMVVTSNGDDIDGNGVDITSCNAHNSFIHLFILYQATWLTE